MPEKISDPDKELQNLLTDTRASGGITHGYVACGSLDGKDPKYELEIGGGNVAFDLASLTKALYVTPEVFLRVRQGEFHLSSRLNEISTLFQSQEYRQIGVLTVGELLSHTSGLQDWLSLWMECPGTPWDMMPPDKKALALIDRSERHLHKCGKSVYSDLGFILLGLLLQAHKSEPEFSDEPRRKRCGLWFANQIPKGHLCTPSGYCPIRDREIQGEVHDENAWYLGGMAGHAGLFSTGRGLVRYLKDLLQGPLGEDLIKAQIPRRNVASGMTGLMGWQQGAGETSLPFGSGKGMGHLGFTGTAFWVVPETRMYGVLLTNRIVSGRSCQWIHRFRAQAFAALNLIVHGNS